MLSRIFLLLKHIKIVSEYLFQNRLNLSRHVGNGSWGKGEWYDTFTINTGPISSSIASCIQIPLQLCIDLCMIGRNQARNCWLEDVKAVGNTLCIQPQVSPVTLTVGAVSKIGRFPTFSKYSHLLGLNTHNLLVYISNVYVSATSIRSLKWVQCIYIYRSL